MTLLRKASRYDIRPGSIMRIRSPSYIWKTSSSGLGTYVTTPTIVVCVQRLPDNPGDFARYEILLNGEKWVTMSYNLTRIRQNERS